LSVQQGDDSPASRNAPADLFILNPIHQYELTDKRNYTYHLWWRYGGLTAILLVITISIKIPELIDEIRLMAMKTASIEAEVVENDVSTDRGASYYYVKYQFIVKNQIYSRKVSVNPSEYNQWPVGAYLPVIYVVDDPSSSHVGDQRIRWESIGSLFLMLFFLVFLLIYDWMDGRSSRLRIQRLRQHGQLIYGQLKSCEGQLILRGMLYPKSEYKVTIHCQFINTTGKQIDTQATLTRNDLEEKELPTGGSVAILYISDDAYQVL